MRRLICTFAVRIWHKTHFRMTGPTYYCEPLETLQDKTIKMTCAPSKDSGQPGHLPIWWSVFAVCMKKHWALNYLLSTQWRLWSDWAYAQADQNLRWGHMSFCWVCCAAAHFIFVIYWSSTCLQTFKFTMYYFLHKFYRCNCFKRMLNSKRLICEYYWKLSSHE